MRYPVCLALFSLSVALSIGFTQEPIAGNATAPTPAEAQAFVDRANALLLKANTDASHAEWTAETDITDDTEATSARLNEQATALTLQLTAESHRFDHVQLPGQLRRQIMLLQVTAPAAPREPDLLAEQTQLQAQLTGMYGKGKFCPPSAWASMRSPRSWPNRTTLRN